MNIRKNTSIGTATNNAATIVAAMLGVMLLLLSTITTPFGNALTATSNAANNNNKVVLLAFYDNPGSQVLNAKPILDQYGFKATFFVVCNWLGKQGRMSLAGHCCFAKSRT